MSDRTLVIVFSNPDAKRIPINTELYLFRRDGSSAHIHFQQPAAAAPGQELPRTAVTGSLSSLP